MAKGTLNKVILIGNLGGDPEVRTTPSDLVVANLRLATTEVWKDRQTGENQERTEWHRVVVYRRLAEIARDYTRKGSKIYIEGKIQTRKWQDQNGQDRYTTEVIADQLQLLDSRGSGGGGGFSHTPGQSSGRAAQRSSDPGPGDNDYPPSYDDDIPF